MPSGHVQHGREGWSCLSGRDEKSDPNEEEEEEDSPSVDDDFLMSAPAAIEPLPDSPDFLPSDDDDDDGLNNLRSASRSAARWTNFLAEAYSSTSS